MLQLTEDRTRCGAMRWLPTRRFCGGYGRSVLLALLAATLLAAMMLSACGSGSSGGSQNNVTVAGNWQFTVAPPADGSFLGGLQGGFLQQDSGSVKGAAAYAVSLSELLIPCNSGSAAIAGTVSGQNVTLTAIAGTQTFTFTGTLSFDGSTMVGTYISTAGTAGDGAPCGTVQTVPMQWSAILVPPITGTIQGSLHSAGGTAGLSNQDFQVSGTLTQAANTGASNAIVTGTLNFAGSDYPCFNSGSDTASVYGQISGNLVTLQIVGSDGSILGEIGETVGPSGATGVSPVTFGPAQNGYILQGVGLSYLVASNYCPGGLDKTGSAGDYGNICVAVESALLGNANACPQAVTLSPSALTFLPQVLRESTTEQITLANTSRAGLNNLTLVLANIPIGSPVNFAETDDCGPESAPSRGKLFDLGAGAGCVITIIFDPLQTCATGAIQCPSAVTATLSLMENLTRGTNPSNETLAVVNITGTGVNADAVSAGAIDFAAEVEERHAEID